MIFKPEPARGRDNVQAKRLADGAWFLGPVEDGDPLDRLGQRFLEGFHVERPVEAGPLISPSLEPRVLR